MEGPPGLLALDHADEGLDIVNRTIEWRTVSVTRTTARKGRATPIDGAVRGRSPEVLAGINRAGS